MDEKKSNISQGPSPERHLRLIPGGGEDAPVIGLLNVLLALGVVLGVLLVVPRFNSLVPVRKLSPPVSLSGFRAPNQLQPVESNQLKAKWLYSEMEKFAEEGDYTTALGLIHWISVYRPNYRDTERLKQSYQTRLLFSLQLDAYKIRSEVLRPAEALNRKQRIRMFRESLDAFVAGDFDSVIQTAEKASAIPLHHPFIYATQLEKLGKFSEILQKRHQPPSQ